MCDPNLKKIGSLVFLKTARPSDEILQKSQKYLFQVLNKILRVLYDMATGAV